MSFEIIFLANIHYHAADKTSSAKDEIKQHIKLQPSWGRATLVVKSGSPPVIFPFFLRENDAPEHFGSHLKSKLLKSRKYYLSDVKSED